MADKSPSYYQTGPCQEVKQKEHLFHLYMDQHVQGTPGGNQIESVKGSPPSGFGGIATVDWSVRDGRARDAKIVARAEGTAIMADMRGQTWLMCYTILFSDERFKGSSLECIGTHVAAKDGQYAVVGGTGEFAGANGVVNVKILEYLPDTTGVLRELNIRASCPCVPNPTPVTKIGPWGGNGGAAFDIQDQPLSIQSVTIRCGDVVNSLAFSYVDVAGLKKNVGPWGGDGAVAATITFAPSETMKQITGTTNITAGEIVITSLTFVTNVTTYGPFGKATGTPFSSQVPDNTSIVGFYARAGACINALGAYVRPN